MKFINYLESISGISVYPMISLILFFTFFIVLGIKVYYMDKQFIEKMDHLPLEDNQNSNETVI